MTSQTLLGGKNNDFKSKGLWGQTLHTLRIVVQKDTSNIITAMPWR